MKTKQVADRLGKHENTIRNYAQQFAEFLSAPPAKGEHRVFTDDDLRVLGFIGRLSDSGMRQDEIRDALKRKLDEGTPFPPILPTAPVSDSQSLVTVQELETQLARKDAELQELQGRVEELRIQVESHRKERENYLEMIKQLSEEIGALKAELKVNRSR